MALPKYLDNYKPFNKEQKKDFYDLMTPHWSNEMAKQYLIDAEEEEYYRGFNGKPIEKLVDTNLKTAAAVNKPKLSDVPPVALFAMGAAMSDGASKYGRYNWRETGTTASVFYDAIHRHLADWYNGEDFAHDSKVHHLAHIMASCAILLDSELHNSMNDDRNKSKPESIARNVTWKQL